MKISLNWLKDYIDFNLDAQAVATTLTGCGLEVEDVQAWTSVPGGLEGLVVGEVKEKKAHPNADKLSVTQVDAGNGSLLNIVCGAPNVAAGQKVILAPAGSTIHTIRGERIEIKKAKIRGEVSEGMICAEDEVGLGPDHEGIVVLDAGAVPGKPVREYFSIAEDTVLDIGLTPNRGDAASHYGVARDLYAALKQAGKAATLKPPGPGSFSTDEETNRITVSVEDSEACPRYSGVTIEGVTVRESPDWLKNRLKAIGQKPISNIVDVTNYVLHELGQPLHAFDAAQIKGNRVIVKTLPEGTKFITLDETERALRADDLMICHAEDGMCIAGVFGGLRSGISEKTTSVFLESACFSPKSIRRTSKHHNLKTDASFRFERGTDPDGTVLALQRAAVLIRDIAGGKVTSGIIDVYPGEAPKAEVDLTWAGVDRLLGHKIDRKVIKSILTSLQFDILKEQDTDIRVLVPSFRTEVHREADVIEEILRVYGCNNIEESRRVAVSYSGQARPDKERIRNAVSDYLAANGFHEIICNSLTKGAYTEIPGMESSVSVTLMNPLSSDLSTMRSSLLPGALEALAYNINRRIEDLKLFEFGSTYEKTGAGGSAEDYRETPGLAVTVTGRKQPVGWRSGDGPADLFFLKAHVGNILNRLGLPDVSEKPVQSAWVTEGMRLHSGNRIIAEYGSVSPALLKAFDIGQPVCSALFNWDAVTEVMPREEIGFRELPRFPAVRRDLALLVDGHTAFAALEKIARKHGGKLLSDVNIFDVYKGKNIAAGKKSYALTFTFMDESKTLKDEEVDAVMKKLMDAYRKDAGAVIR